MQSSTDAFIMFKSAGVVPSSAEISGTAMNNDVPDQVAARVIQLTVKRIVHLRHVEKPVGDVAADVAVAGPVCTSASVITAIARTAV